MTDACSSCGLKEAPYYDSNGLCPLCSPAFDSGNRPESPDSIRDKAVNSPNGNDPNNPSSPIRERALEMVSVHGGIRPAARAIGKELGMKVNPGIIGLALKGEDFPKARRVLGLPQKTVEVEPCADCGKVHERLHTCDERRQRNKRTKANGWTRPAAWVYKDDRPAFDRWLQRQGCENLQELVDRAIAQENE